MTIHKMSDYNLIDHNQRRLNRKRSFRGIMSPLDIFEMSVIFYNLCDACLNCFIRITRH